MAKTAVINRVIIEFIGGMCYSYCIRFILVLLANWGCALKKFSLVVLVCYLGSANAGQQSTQFTINGNVSATCTSVSANNVTLPGSLTSSQNATTNLIVNCSNNLPYIIAVASTNNWALKYVSGTDLINYTLNYTGVVPGVNATWSGGTGTTTVTTSSMVATGANQTYPLKVISTAPTGAVSAGSYNDAVTVYVNF